MAQSIILLWCCATSLAGAAVTTLQTVDGGGARAQSANYVADQSLAGIVGISTIDAPAQTIRHGYIGQLTDLSGFAVQLETNAVDEGGSQQLSGVALLDDDTLLAVAGSEVAWGATVFPLGSLAESGLVTATTVYQDTTAAVTGWYVGLSGADSFLVRNASDDDFDTYAGDGLPDDWQVGYFGIGNPEGGPTNNVDEDPYDNIGEWMADTSPTDGDDFFQIVAVSNGTSAVALAFESSAARRYNLEAGTDLVATDWAPVVDRTAQEGTGTLLWLNDTNPPPAAFYRVTVTVP